MTNSDQTSLAAGRCGSTVSSMTLVVSLALIIGLVEVATAQGPKASTKTEPGNPKTKKPPEVKGEEINIDPVKLPPNYQPPKPPLAIMNLEKPIVTADELKKLRNEWQRFSKVKSDCDLSAPGRKTIEASIRYRLASFTVLKASEMQDNPAKILQMRQEFLRELATVGSPGKREADKAAMSKFLYEEVLRQIPELLKNNFYVRLNAVLILSELDYKLAYVPSYETLLQVITAKDIRDDEADGQPEPIKIDAVKGLIRILRFAEPPVKDKTIIANVIVQELSKKDPSWWRQKRMIEVLRYCGITGVDAGNNNRPFVLDCLMSIVRDSERDWGVRAKACYAIGRVPIPASIKPEDVVFSVADFAYQLGNAAAAAPEKPAWKSCFWDLYTAFHAFHRPKDREQDLDAEGKRDGGLLNSAKTAAQPVYDLIVPMVNDVLNGKGPDAGSLKKLGDYVRARQPVANQKP